MSQSGDLTFYTLREISKPTAALQRVVNYLRPECVPIIFRSKEEDHGWDNFLADEDDPDYELLPSLPTGDGLDRYYRENIVLSAKLYSSPIGLKIGRSVETQVPKEIRGDFIPTDPIVKIGWHDLWECAEHHEGLFFARAFLSVGFFGYFTPNNWQAFREAVFKIPEIQEVKTDLERVVGMPLEGVIYWSV